MLKDQIREALSHVQDPELGRDSVSLGMVREISVDLCAVEITIALTTMQ
jgi:metal-sulfur cluster biosynthetic enzyme